MYFVAIDCVWSDWGPFGDCDQTCGAGFRHSTRTSTGPFYGGAECVGDATQKQPCNLMEELEMALESCQAENKRLKQQVNCEPSKCKITVYQEVKTVTETCQYLPDGLGDTEMMRRKLGGGCWHFADQRNVRWRSLLMVL